ncbi:MAG: SMP-30/gluconolactonase/LRE family protein [Acuticoccus sp.]
MRYEIRNEAFGALIDPDAPLQTVGGGFGFTEGPIWHPDEHWLMFSDIQNSRQYRWSEADGLTLFRRPSNQANGNCFDRSGRIISCEHTSSRVVRHEHDGKLVKVIASHFEGMAFNSPNDVVCDSKGRIWFTDPTFGRVREELGILRPQELPFQGVFRLDPDGALTCVASDYEQPNGLCFSADETRLFVNDTVGGHIRVYAVDAAGHASGGAVWAEISGTGEGRPDGMKVTTGGHILCNGPGGVHVLSPQGETLGVIRIPEKSTNFCFGGPGNATLFVTASTSVYRIRTRLEGFPMI